jgi:hypothetical protein
VISVEEGELTKTTIESVCEKKVLDPTTRFNQTIAKLLQSSMHFAISYNYSETLHKCHTGLQDS